jgi:hypothetical protein
MNRRKRGRPYRIAESYVRFLAVIRYLFSLGQDDKILRIQNLEQNGGIW